jgi:hypothetical protein
MKSSLAVVALGAGLLGLVAPAVAADTLTGEVVDLACYLPHPETGSGPSHKKCAETCLKKGMPMGIVTEDKQVWVLLEDHENPKPYAQVKDKAAEKVTVEGEKVTQGGVQGLVVGEVK